MTARIDYETAAPAGIKALGGVYSYVSQSGLDPVLVELVYLRVSQINGCAYCLETHTRALLKREIVPEKLAVLQVWREAGKAFSARERAALSWAETVTQVAQTAIPDEAFEDVSSQFEEKEVVDLTIAVGLMNTFNRVAIAFRRPPTVAEA
ncbi:carboxymuconolactone decarboxylase family protein [Gluconobacter cerinus]|uniref:carboxymuconolactone decarboxylase family protein n=1 Tax=Gluconobacter cerinus TaxID=38307 RepID=UPI001B8BAD88|nr:carboxymuconolactone decarboxylase family protein [Gluconobacter cerinus]MBS1072995.1 carboxymuconolactone decarboxylase family protein [Gluconobacter cerinus]